MYSGSGIRTESHWAFVARQGSSWSGKLGLSEQTRKEKVLTPAL